MVLKDGRCHPVARFPGEPLRDHVDRLRGVLRKDRDPCLAADEPGHFLVGVLVALRRHLRQAVNPPPDV